MPRLADLIVPPARLTLGYGQELVKDVKPDHFARKPEGVDTNHPAWVYGHLAVYPDKSLLPMLGRADAAEPSERFEELFHGTSKCQDDPEGAIYPSMEEITTRFFSRTEAVINALAETPDDVLAAPLPDDHFFKSRMDSFGDVINFMLLAHNMMHFGQISAWRRCMGLGPCM